MFVGNLLRLKGWVESMLSLLKNKVNKIRGVVRNNKLLAANILGAFLIKGMGMIVSLLSMPLYMKFFKDNEILGVWFTIINVLNWILSFDLGIGNGLRNHLTVALSKKDYKHARSLISSSYITLGTLMLLLALIFCFCANLIDWNNFFNISKGIISPDVLTYCVVITFSGVLLTFAFKLVMSILYALQLSSINNLIVTSTSLLTLIYLFVATSGETPEQTLMKFSIAHLVFSVLPPLIATIFVFRFTELRKCLPRISCFEFASAKKVLSLGLLFLCAQMLYMLLSVTNEWFISKYYNPAYTVDYICYFRIFNIIVIVYSLALTPLWSAITKAYAEKKYLWIIKLSKILNLCLLGLFFGQFILIPLLPYIFKIWLGTNAPEVDITKSLIFILYNSVVIWASNISILLGGMAKVTSSIICQFIGVVIKFSLIIILSEFIDNWMLVVVVGAIAMLPYCIVQPFVIRKTLKTLSCDA